METFLLLVLSFVFVAGVFATNCNFCIHATCRPSMIGIPASKFNAFTDSQTLNAAMEGLGTEENILISVLTSRSEPQRLAIADEYTKLKSNLVSSIYSETSLRFRNIMVALVTPLVTFYTKQLTRAVQDSDRSVISEILGSLSPCVIRQLSNKYQELNDKRSLYDDLQKINFKGMVLFSRSDYITLVKSLAQGDRDESTTVDHSAAVQDASKLRDAGVGMVGTKLSVFIEIFTKRSIPQLAEILKRYESLRRNDWFFKSLEKDLEGEFTVPSVIELFMIIAKNAMDQPLYFAQEIEKLMNKYWLSNEDCDKLIRIMRGRGDIDMEDIKEAYQREYKKSLADRIDGAFKLKTRFPRTLVSIVNGGKK